MHVVIISLLKMDAQPKECAHEKKLVSELSFEFLPYNLIDMGGLLSSILIIV